ncbi:MAG: hypothetical protein J6M35_05180 [Clostridia bacterium]|nr:hypothetical protein [Clostridia bacterium]
MTVVNLTRFGVYVYIRGEAYYVESRSSRMLTNEMEILDLEIEYEKGSFWRFRGSHLYSQARIELSSLRETRLRIEEDEEEIRILPNKFYDRFNPFDAEFCEHMNASSICHHKMKLSATDGKILKEEQYDRTDPNDKRMTRQKVYFALRSILYPGALAAMLALLVSMFLKDAGEANIIWALVLTVLCGFNIYFLQAFIKFVPKFMKFSKKYYSNAKQESLREKFRNVNVNTDTDANTNKPF